MKQRGFTIMELIIAIAITGAVAAIGIPAFSGIQNNTDIKSDKAIGAQIGQAMLIKNLEDGNKKEFLNQQIKYEEIPNMDVYIDTGYKPSVMKDGYYIVSRVSVDSKPILMVGITKEEQLIDVESLYNGKRPGWVWSEAGEIEKFIKDNSGKIKYEHEEIDPSVKYTITANSTVDGGIIPSGINEVISGQSKVFTSINRIDKEGSAYMFLHWVIDGVVTEDVDLDEIYTFDSVNSNHTIEAVYVEESKYKLTVELDNILEMQTDVLPGDQIKVGSNAKSYIVSNIPNQTTGTFTFDMPENEVTIRGIYNINVEECSHNYNNVEIIQHLSCENVEITRYTCDLCGCSYDETTNKDLLEHDYYEESRNNITCVDGGYIYYYCSNCGLEKKEYVSATGHNYTSEIIQERTCKVAEITKYTCTSCGDSYNATTQSKMNHSYKVESRTEPTCEENGIQISKCIYCGFAEYRDLFATGHNYVGTTTEPTCAAVGIKTYTCSRCSASYTEEIEKLPHNWKQWDNSMHECQECETQGDCYGDIHNCEVCGGKISEHDWVETGSTHTCANPSCPAWEYHNYVKNASEDIYQCTGCWAISTYGTCSSCGYEYTSCPMCDTLVCPQCDYEYYPYCSASCKQKTECGHWWQDGACAICGYECRHAWEQNRMNLWHRCSICGLEGSCTSDGAGSCSVCYEPY